MDVLIAYAAPVFLLLLAVEFLIARAHPVAGGRGYEGRDTVASLGMGIGNVVVAGVCKAGAVVLFFAAYEFRLFDLGQAWWVWLLLIPAEDFCYYWFHRLHHEIRFLWAAHVNHHSSRYFNLSTALRQSWTTPLTGPWFWLPLALLGFHPVMILTAQAISLVYQFWLHTELLGRLGPLDWVMNTPSHHRVHHGRNVEYLDRNYAGIFIVWDRLFGSYEPERAPVDYGLTKNLETTHLWKIAFHEWSAMFRDARRADSTRNALRTLLDPPGWSPDGSTLTARQMRGLNPRVAGASPSGR